MNLNEKIDAYQKIQSEMETLKEQLDSLKSEILMEMEEQGTNTMQTGAGNIAKIIDRCNFKYVDELSMIKFLKDNGYSGMVKEVINTTSLNGELKKKTLLSESLKPYYTEQMTKALTVKGV